MSEKPRLKDGVIRRGSTWAYVIRVTDGSGQSKPKWVSGFPTEDAAKAARDEARVAARRGEFVHRNDLTVEQYLKTWLDGHALEVRPKTLEDYRSLIERYVVPRLGKMRLQSVKPATVSAFYGTLRREGGRDGGPLSPRTVNYVHSVLRKALNDAVHTDQLLAVNPTLRAKRPRVEAVQPVHAMWGREELQQFLTAVKDHRLYPFFRLAAFTGARRGELFYLHWPSVMLDGPDPHIWIAGSTAIVRGHRVDGMTKTGRARRVSIDEGTVQALCDHAAQQAKEQEVVGSGWPDTDRVFRMEMGGPLRVDFPGEVMRSTIAAINGKAKDDPAINRLRPIRLHDLRHVHATLLLKAGVPVHVVAARLGHRDAAMTLRVYAHVLSDQATSAAAVFANFMGEEGPR